MGREFPLHDSKEPARWSTRQRQAAALVEEFRAPAPLSERPNGYDYGISMRHRTPPRTESIRWARSSSSGLREPLARLRGRESIPFTCPASAR